MKIIKSIGMLLLDVCFVIIIMFCFGNIWDTCNGRTELDYEFVSTMEFSGEKADSYQEGVVHIYRMDKNVIIKNISER